MILKKENKQNIIDIYDDYILELQDELDKNNNQEKNNHEEENWINYEVLKKKVEDIINENLNKTISFTRLRLLLLVSLFSQIPPARISNYLNMKIIEDNKKADDKEKNYYNKKTNEFIFNNYKTSKYLGSVTYKIKNDTLINLINKWLSPNYNNTDNFLVDLKKNLITPNQNISKLISNASETYLNKKINLNLYRKIYLTWFLNTNPSITQKTEVFKIIGHQYQPSTAEKYYKKN